MTHNNNWIVHYASDQLRATSYWNTQTQIVLKELLWVSRQGMTKKTLPAFCHQIFVNLLQFLRLPNSAQATRNQVDKVQLVDRLGVEPNVVGTLHVTTSHIIFRSEAGTKELW
ncbi:hypothetical protein TELCIR_06980, partial [Teladorsagia circumcincta]